MSRLEALDRSLLRVHLALELEAVAAEEVAAVCEQHELGTESLLEAHLARLHLALEPTSPALSVETQQVGDDVRHARLCFDDARVDVVVCWHVEDVQVVS